MAAALHRPALRAALRPCGKPARGARGLLVLAQPERRQLRLSETVPHAREAVFAVVADVGSYKDFVPFCGESTVLSAGRKGVGAEDGEGSFDARLSLGFYAFSEQYVSRVTLRRPGSIVAAAKDTNLFEFLRTEWRFEEASEERCTLHFHLDLLLRSSLHDQALKRVIDRVARQQVDAFMRRCDEIEGKRRLEAKRRPSSVATSTAASQSSPASTWSLPPVEPAWRQRVDSAFDAHASGGALSLPRFVEACRALQVAPPRSLLPHYAPPAAAAAAAATAAAAASTAASASAVAAALPSSVQHASLAAWFVHFDEDSSGDVDRDEFRRNLWMLTRATEEERMAYAFRRLDANGSGELERSDLEESMRRQLVSLDSDHTP